MDKSIHSEEHRRLCALLRDIREKSGLRQVDVAEALEVTQSRISSYENGERRLDIIELRKICEALGLSLGEFVERFEAAEVAAQRAKRRKKSRQSTRSR